MVRTRDALGTALQRSESVLGISERLMEMMASCGVHTPDTPYIELAQRVAAQISVALGRHCSVSASRSKTCLTSTTASSKALSPGSMPPTSMPWPTNCFPIPRARPAALPDIVFCIAADRNGYISTHNGSIAKGNVRAMVWNTAHSRWRRVFNDRTGLASAPIRGPSCCKPIAATWGGQFVLLKRRQPHRRSGRHWGGLRLAYRFTT